jgi:hypothetical protein
MLRPNEIFQLICSHEQLRSELNEAGEAKPYSPLSRANELAEKLKLKYLEDLAFELHLQGMLEEGEETQQTKGSWEMFCDESHYGMYFVRQTAEKDFNSPQSFHFVHKIDAAVALDVLSRAICAQKGGAE